MAGETSELEQVSRSWRCNELVRDHRNKRAWRVWRYRNRTGFLFKALSTTRFLGDILTMGMGVVTTREVDRGFNVLRNAITLRPFDAIRGRT